MNRDRDSLKKILKEVYQNTSKLFDNKLIFAVLYGSYARGDYDFESDIDIALIVDMERTEIKKYSKALVSQMAYFLNMYDIVINFNEIPLKEFEEYKDTLPYYRNIYNEGVRIGA